MALKETMSMTFALDLLVLIFFRLGHAAMSNRNFADLFQTTFRISKSRLPCIQKLHCPKSWGLIHNFCICIESIDMDPLKTRCILNDSSQTAVSQHILIVRPRTTKPVWFENTATYCYIRKILIPPILFIQSMYFAD